MSNEVIDKKHVDEVCKMGKGAECCRYLTCGPTGFNCEKHSSMAAHLDSRVKEKTINARGDNCQGWKAELHKGESLWNNFLDDLVAAVVEGTEKGTPKRLCIGGKHEITIDIYESKAQMKVFNEAILETAKEHRGFSLRKGGKKS